MRQEEKNGPTKERLRLIKGDVTKLFVDAVVNAANNSLLGGGGVDGAIHRAAGPELLEECRKIGGCPTGEVRCTLGYRLPAKYVFHTVGPIWKGGSHGEPELLAACYRNCLNLGRKMKLESVAFPSISTGAYGFPLETAAAISMEEISIFVSGNEYPRMVLMTLFSENDLEVYRSALRTVHDHKASE